MNRYDSYKPTGIEWIGDIPEHWEVKKLKYGADIVGGFAFKSEEFEEVGTPVIRIGDISSSLNLDECKKTTQDHISEIFRVKENDTLIALSGATVGKMCIIKTDLNAFINQRVARITNGTRWMHYVLNSDFIIKQIKLEAGGSAQENISTYNIGNFFIPIAPEKEQNTIANYLNLKTAQIDNLIANKQQLIALLKEERTAIINEAVSGEGKSWERKKLKYVAGLRDDIVQDCDFKITVESIESGSGRLVNMLEEKTYQGSLSEFKTGDTIFNKLRPYLHKVYLAEKDGGLYGELLILFSKGEVIPDFLYYILFSKDFINVVDSSTQGTKMPRASWSDFISQLVVSFPNSKNEQEVVVESINTSLRKIDSILGKIQIELELIQEFRTAIISEVVTGKIKVV